MTNQQSDDRVADSAMPSTLPSGDLKAAPVPIDVNLTALWRSYQIVHGLPADSFEGLHRILDEAAEDAGFKNARVAIEELANVVQRGTRPQFAETSREMRAYRAINLAFYKILARAVH